MDVSPELFKVLLHSAVLLAVLVAGSRADDELEWDEEDDEWYNNQKLPVVRDLLFQKNGFWCSREKTVQESLKFPELCVSPFEQR